MRCIGARERGGLRHHPDDLRQHGLAAHVLGPHDERPLRIDRRADQPVARLLVDGNRLSGKHRLVHRAAAVEHHAIHRHLLSRAHAQPVADVHVRQWNVLLRPVIADPARGLGRKPQKRFDRGSLCATAP